MFDEKLKMFDENSKKWFANTCKFCTHDINKFFSVAEMFLLLWIHGLFGKTQWKVITWKRSFFSHLEDVTDADCTHRKRVSAW